MSDDAVDGVRAAIADAVRRLAAAGAREEWLGEVVVPRRVLGVGRPPRIDRRGTVWRVGTLLIARDGAVHATGTTTRVTDPGRPQGLTASVELRRAERAAALAGGFALGEVVNHGTAPIAIDASLVDAPADAVLAIRDGVAWVRWGRTPAERTRLDAYLADQLDLLEHPPQGA
ncbi:hypothetical protein [Agrococcus jejuensis]|uniref:Glutaminase n=1 Tax=Agrococcus jejuensis TaxID=399736 RepID=A0A1G8FKD4_9MICO|nr:hypothetical protein [Agrococcus jejuensis]SDH82622.1 hypothetical protein SAMN04489720_2516 [Agrococcus jejuensis]